jgi:hypothetical protein
LSFASESNVLIKKWNLKNNPMAEDKISSYIDRDGIKGDTKFLLDEINTAYEAIKKYNAQKPSLDAAKGYEAAATAIKKQKDSQDELAASSAKLNDAANRTAKSLQDTVATINATKASNEKLSGSYDDLIKASVANQVAAKGLAQARKELDLSFKQGIISADDYTNILADIKKKEVEITVSNLDLNRAIRNTEKGFQSVEGSTNAMRAELNLALQAFDRLSEADKGSEFGVKLKADINELTDKIKVQEEGTQRFQRNVGNYQGSAKIIVDALSAVEKKMGDLKEKQTQLNTQAAKDPVGFKFGKGAEQLNQVNAALATTEKEFNALNTITESPKFFNLAAKTGDARTEIRGFTTALVELERKGLGSSDFAVEMRKHLAELTDQVADTKDEIKALSSDTRSFDQLTSSVNLLTNSYQTFVGIQALAGEQDAETEETIKKLVAVQSISNGLGEIGEQLTKRGTLANKAYTLVQGLMTTATDASATATVRLAAATKLLLGGLILGGIVLLVMKLKEWSEEASKIVTRQKVLNQAAREAADSYGQEKAKLDVLIATIKTEGISRKAKFDTLKQLQEAYPGYFDNIKTEDELNNKLAIAYQNAAKGILLKAKANAAGDILSKNETQKLQAEIDKEEKIQKLQEERQKKKAQTGAGGIKVYEDKRLDQRFLEDVAAANKAYQKQADDIDKTNKFLVDSIQDANKQIESLGGKVTTGKDTPADKKKKENKDLENELKAQFELEKINQQKIINLHKTIADSEGIPQNVRIAERLKQFEEERKLAIMQQDFELSNTKLTGSEKLLIIEKTNQDILKAESDAAIGIIAIKKNTDDQLKADAEATAQWSQEAIHRQTEDQIKAINDGLEARLNVIKQQGDAELEKAANEYKEGKINKAQFEKEKIEIENRARKASLLAEIEYQARMVQISNLSPEEKYKALKKLADLEDQVRKESISADIEAGNRFDAEQERRKAKLKDLANELKETAFTIATAGIDRQKNEIQDQIDALEAKKQKEIEVATQSISNEQQRAAAITTIEARAAAEKERLERRKRQLDEQKARFERAKNIAEIIANTARAVADALPNVVLAAIVGGIGAAQLARVLATPIPKFYGGKSRENKYEGQAIVGDGGRQEAIIREGGKVEITPNTPTQTWVGRNDVIIPDARQLIEHDFKLAINNTGKLVNGQSKTPNINPDPNAERRHKELIRAIKTQPQPIIKGLSKRDLIMKFGYSWQKYLND